MAEYRGSPVMWTYRVRSPEGAWWADVVLRADGWFGAVSDWQAGSNGYAFWWTSVAGDFRAFIAQINAQYLHSKIGGKDVVDREGTLARCQLALFDLFEAEGGSEWALCLALDRLEREYDLEHAEEVLRWISEDMPNLASDSLPDLLVTVPEPMSWAFCKKVLPALQAMIRSDLAGKSPEATL